MPDTSALDTLINNYQTETPVSWYDFYNAYGSSHSTTGYWENADPNSVGARINNWFFGTADTAKSAYENYLAEYENRRNMSAQQAEWAREDSAVQRAVRDIEAAGLNPWLALNGGSMSSAINANQSEPVRYKTREQQLKATKAKSQAGKLLTTAAKLIMFLAIMG